MKVMVTVNAYVSTMQEIELPDDFDVTDENAMYELAHSEHIRQCLMDNAEECINCNREVSHIYDTETNEVIYEG